MDPSSSAGIPGSTLPVGNSRKGLAIPIGIRFPLQTQEYGFAALFNRAAKPYTLEFVAET